MSLDEKKPYKAAAIGNFDGLHLAHQRLLRELCRHARERGGEAAVLSFKPHPLALLSGSPPLLISGEEDKERLIRGCFGIESILYLPFDEKLAQMTPQDFVRNILKQELRLGHVFVGFNFTFGRFGQGDTALLQELCAQEGIGTTVIPACASRHGVISSSLIRGFLEQGRIETVSELLGYWYHLRGMVESGRQMGRQLGFPTANLRPPAQRQLPPNGVYAVRAEVNGAIYEGVANLGLRPTFEAPKKGPLLETHLFGLPPDSRLTVTEITVYFAAFLREERRFSGPDELKKQVAEDICAAKKILSANVQKSHLPGREK
ncbi:MAG: riboflavin biosynthesis protein RibF [Clostridiales bacterium]|nr:riboflavin biosynthesis protein RibF [Clostridiales bacterium]